MTSTKANVLSLEDSEKMKNLVEGPFTDGIRVHCPLKSFAVRKTKFCIGCNFFKGIIKRQMSGEPDMKDLKIVSRMFSVFCSHPVNRSLCEVPED